jgi:hypothetical protein
MTVRCRGAWAGRIDIPVVVSVVAFVWLDRMIYPAVVVVLLAPVPDVPQQSVDLLRPEPAPDPVRDGPDSKLSQVAR